MLAVSAVDPSLLALAVVTGAVGSLDDTGGAAGVLVVAGVRGLHAQGQDDHDGGQRQEDQAGGGGAGHF